MLNNKKSRKDMRYKRHRRIRNKVKGTTSRPRLNIFRSLNNIYAQIIDDTNGKTVVSYSTIHKDFSSFDKKISSMESAKIVGKKIAELALEKKITKVVFDRNGYLYHGKVKALADAARDAGLQF